jgi:hypothetical protein
MVKSIVCKFWVCSRPKVGWRLDTLRVSNAGRLEVEQRLFCEHVPLRCFFACHTGHCVMLMKML